MRREHFTDRAGWNGRRASEVVSNVSFLELVMDKKDEKRVPDKQGGHHLPPNGTENPMDDTDRFGDKVVVFCLLFSAVE